MVILFNIIEDHGLLEHFLRYYHMRGVTHFVCGMHNGQKNPHRRDIERKLGHYSHCIYCSYSDDFSGERDAESQNRVLPEVLSPDQWYLVADPDEFHYHPAFASFSAMQMAALSEGATYVASQLYDRLSGNGPLRDLNPSLTLDDQFPYAGLMTDRILGGCSQKVVMARRSVAVTPGHHFADGKKASFICRTHHFKWQGSQLPRRMKERMLTYQQQGAQYWAEPLRFLEFYKSCGETIDIRNPQLGVVRAERIGV